MEGFSEGYQQQPRKGVSQEPQRNVILRKKQNKVFLTSRTNMMSLHFNVVEREREREREREIHLGDFVFFAGIILTCPE